MHPFAHWLGRWPRDGGIFVTMPRLGDDTSEIGLPLRVLDTGRRAPAHDEDSAGDIMAALGGHGSALDEFHTVANAS